MHMRRGMALCVSNVNRKRAFRACSYFGIAYSGRGIVPESGITTGSANDRRAVLRVKRTTGDVQRNSINAWHSEGQLHSAGVINAAGGCSMDCVRKD